MLYPLSLSFSPSLSLFHTLSCLTLPCSYQRALDEGKPQYSIVGYTTVYGFYAYPDKTRARVSQMLILPPYQRKGHGGTYVHVQCICAPPHPPPHPKHICTPLVLKARHLHNNIIMVALTGIRFA